MTNVKDQNTLHYNSNVLKLKIDYFAASSTTSSSSRIYVAQSDIGREGLAEQPGNRGRDGAAKRREERPRPKEDRRKEGGKE